MNRTELIEARKKALAALQTIVDAAKSEDRDLTHDEREKSTRYVEEVKDIDGKLDAIDESAARKSELADFLTAAEARDLNDPALDGSQQGPGRAKSVGARILKSEQYRRLMERHGGRIGEATKGISMDPVAIGGLKALLTGSDRDSGAGVLVPSHNLGLVEYPQHPLSLRDLITVGTTTSDRIEYAQVLPAGVGGSTNAAAGIPEATGTTGTQGVKPESTLAFRKQSADVITIAHWLPTTKRALSDAGQLQTLIDGFLRDGVARETERLIVSGDSDNAPANTEEWDGILNTTGVQSVAYAGSISDTARKMITAVSDAAAITTGFIVSPEVNEALDLAKDTTGRYFGNGPFGQGPGTLWGRPRVEVQGLPEGTIIGGDLSTCVLWDREQTTVTATDSHADFFIRNLVAILAEARAAFGIFNPQSLAIAEVDLTGDAGTGE